MVLQFMKVDVDPAQVDEYFKWVPGAVKRAVSVPGIKEFRVYRSVTGKYQSISMYEFPDMVSWAKWRDSEEVQKALEELQKLSLGITIELFTSSPVLPDPIRV